MSNCNKIKLVQALEQLAVNDHLCLIYETREEQFAAVVPFLRIGLERGEKCLYIVDENTATSVLDALKVGGVDSEAALQSGALVIANKQEAYLKQGYFDPDEMIRFLKQATDSAKAAGFSALRTTGEMTWALGGDPGVERLIEYEAKLNHFFPDNNALAICQYNRNCFSPEIILDVIRTHPLVIYGGTVCRNLYYVPPDEFLKPDRPGPEVQRLLNHVLDREQAEEALKARERQQAVVAKLGQRALTGMDVDTLMDTTVALLAQTLDVEYSKVLELLPDGNALLLRAGIGWKEGYVRCATVSAGTESQAGYTLLSSETVIVEDLRTEIRFSGPPLLHEHGVISGVSVIIAGKARPFGVLGVHTTRRRKFTADDIHFLQAVANVLVLAIERKQAEEALRKAGALLEKIFASLNEVVFVVDHATRTIIACNPAVERIFGYKNEDVIGRNTAFLHVNHTMYEEFGRRLNAEIDSKGVFHTEYQLRRKEGDIFPTEHTVTEILDDASRRTGLVSVVRDITERKQTEEMRQRYTVELEQRVSERTMQLREANEELEAFVYSASHDLRAPLLIMQGLSDALLEDYAGRLDVTGQEYARNIASSARHLEDMIEDLLAYSRISRAELQLQPISLDAVVEEVLGLLQEEIRGREAQITVEKPLPRVMGHHATLVQVLENLVSNAVKFVAPGVQPRLCIRAETISEVSAIRNLQSAIRLWVEDNGIGIAPEYHEGIFRIFERLHGVETYPGTGVGLATVCRGVLRLGGQVGLVSAPGEGSKFWIELQAAEK